MKEALAFLEVPEVVKPDLVARLEAVRARLTR